MNPNSTDTYRTLLDVFWRDRTFLRIVVLMIAGSLLLTLSAKIKVPFYPVPMTMQTLAVMLIGFIYGWRMAAATVLFYLAQGALGLPVFAGTPEKGIGLGYMMGPTGGYLLGFVLAAMLCGWLAEQGWDRSPGRLVAAMILANGVIYLLGLGWLGGVVGWDKPVLAWGMIPFLYGDLLKIVLGAGLLTAGWRLLDR